MRSVFADTFCWIVLTNVEDLAHEKAKALMLPLHPRSIITTEEVLTEYLNYFGGWGANFRRKALVNTQQDAFDVHNGGAMDADEAHRIQFSGEIV
jgi:uncharacterized protein